jgi:hypothetical protein
VAVLGAILVFLGGGPFSPGPLSAEAAGQQQSGGFDSHADFEQECGQCHAPWRGIAAARCETCHTDVAAQRNNQSGLHGRLHDVERCQLCHTDHEGRDASMIRFDLATFEHERLTDFSLARHQTGYDGQPLACEQCHLDRVWTAEAVDCIACHTEADRPFMIEHTAFFGQVCLACHDGRDSAAEFDHTEHFPLDGAHAEVECAGCHTQPVVDGTPAECVGCHEEPDVHAGQFGTDCRRCHTTAAWLPAQLTQHTFPLDHGGEGEIPCATCHTTTYAEYTCTNCHAHDDREELLKEHDEVVTQNLDLCADCHATGLKEEAEGSEIERESADD